MHDNEIAITEKDVRLLLQQQFPQFADLKLSYIKESGTENALYRLGDEYIVRLPRFVSEIDAFEKNERTLEKEWKYLPYLAKYLSFSISRPLFNGKPTKDYPFSWTIAKWNEGQNPDFEKKGEYHEFAKDMAEFVNQLHAIPAEKGPHSRRGVMLINLDQETQDALSQLKEDIDVPEARLLWESLRDIPYWEKELVWIHGDLLPGNILINRNRLSAIIDFSDLGLGDPACDLIPAWCLFNKTSRQIFKDNLLNVNENTWLRGKGWALSIALILLPYYKTRSPMMATLARQMLKNIFSAENVN
jgi:aminoglycoside phosphotransferase (APT) family kinase protein